MKTLIISNMYPSDKYPSYGIFVKKFKNELDIIGYDSDIISMTKADGKLNKILQYLKYFFNVITSLSKSNIYDIVYVHYASHSAIPVIISKLFNRELKIYTNVHGSDVIPETKLGYKINFLTEMILKKSDKIVVPSKYFEELVIEKYNIKNKDICIYPSGGVNSSIFKVKEQDEIASIKKNYNIPLDKKVIGYASRIDTGKGWDVFLKCLNILKDKEFLDDKVVLIIGNGKELDKFKLMINQLKLEKYMKYLGLQNQEKLSELYNIMDVFCFPTYRDGESLGLVALEAMACGVPVIGSDMCAIKDYIINGINGFKFIPKDEEDMANKIEELFNTNITEIKENCVKISKKFLDINVRNELKSILDI